MKENTSPSEAAKRLHALRTVDRPKWRKVLEKAFAGDGVVTINDACDRLGGISRDTLFRHVLELEEETGERLNRPDSGRKDGS